MPTEQQQTAPDASLDDGRVFTSTDQIATLNRRNGHHWFSRETRTYFDSRLYGSVHYGRYFISSERMDDYPRAYKVRYANHEARVSTPEGQPLGGFSTYTAAARWLDKQI